MQTETAQMSFREQLRKLLVEKDMKLTELAQNSGVSYQTLKGYTAKNTDRKPSVPQLMAICKALSVSADVFADCDDFQLRKRPQQGQAGEAISEEE